MFNNESTGLQTSTVNFRLKNASNANSLPISFVGRDIRIGDLREKIAERIKAPSGSHLILYDGSGRPLSTDPNEKIPAYSEILVARTIEEQGGAPRSNMPAQQSSSSSGAAGGMNSEKTTIRTATGQLRTATLDFSSSGPLTRNGMTEEEAIAALADDVARDTGAGTATFGGRGLGGAGGRGGGGMQQNRGGFGAAAAAGGKPQALSNAQPLGQAPSERVTCILCGQKGHWPSECPQLQAAKNANGGRGGGQTHIPRRYAMANGIPESELELCSPEEASHITAKGDFVRRRVVGLGLGLGNGILGGGAGAHNNNGNSNSNNGQPRFKCLHCGIISVDVTQFSKLPCGGEKQCNVACRKCIDDDKCIELSDDGPVCVKCRKEIDAEEIKACKTAADLQGTAAVLGGGGSGGERRDREE